MKILRTVHELRTAMAQARQDGKTIGLVPTMGALHQGHLSLVKAARADNDCVVVSVFVNPTQFNNPADLKTYPRTEAADAELLENAGVDFAFIPSVEEVYPEPDTRVFDLGPVAEVMEGAMRPGHFNGVAQIVSKLFSWTMPDRAYFGCKDFQQIAVIRRMVELEGFNIEIVACPIVREPDGLALSSRNVRLTPEGRKVAPGIYQTLQKGTEYGMTHNVGETQKYVTELIDDIPGLRTEYFTIADTRTMQPLAADMSPAGAVGCVTVHCGDVRLIDNIVFPAAGK
ncbi:MAG: pantoate--beta-alanine ligase [Muribaculaceae bacterium]|nr:pantoate--beta-alanine ligase [Muribaculaceae bacterium]